MVGTCQHSPPSLLRFPHPEIGDVSHIVIAKIIPMNDGDYILGTRDDEVIRLGLQHRVWRERMLACWRRAGFTCGQSLIDVGAGPGYASLDLAEIVGSNGWVHAVERSPHFIEVGRRRCTTPSCANITYHHLDLVADELPIADQDGAWCRWVLSFVSNPDLVINKVSRATKKGGIFALHEYLDYSTWQLLSSGIALSGFVAKTIESWLLSGGCANIGTQLPNLLIANGFKIKSAEPIIFSMTPRDYAWQWPKEFAISGSSRLVELGIMSKIERETLLQELELAGRNSDSIMISPVVLEIIAERT